MIDSADPTRAADAGPVTPTSAAETGRDTGRAAPRRPRNGRRSLRNPASWASVVILAAACAVAVVAQPFVGTYTSATADTQDGAGRVGFVVLMAAGLAVVWALHRASAKSLAPGSDIFVPARLIVALFASFSLGWLMFTHFTLDAFARGRFGYIEWLNQVANLADSRGIWNVWTPYPQGTQELVVGLHSLAAALGAWLNSDVWSAYTIFRIAFQLVFLTAPSILAVWLTGKLARSFGRHAETIGTLTMALSFGFVYYGTTTAYVTDPLPVLLTLAALWLMFRQHVVLAGATLGVGVALKLFPVLLLPALLIALPRKAGLRLLGATVAVVVACLGPALIGNSEMFLSPLHWQASRPPWESWYAFVDWASNAPHEYSAPYFQDASAGSAFGWVFTGLTPVPAVLQVAVPAGETRWENVISLLGTVLTLGLILAARRTTSPRSVVRWSLFSLSAVFLWGIGWSPQYELYLLPLILLSFDNPLVGAATALVLQMVTFLDYPLLLPWAYFYGGAVVWLEWAAVLARYLVLGWLCLYVLQREASVPAFLARLRAQPPRALAPALISAMCLLSAWGNVAVAEAAQPVGAGTCGTPAMREPLLVPAVGDAATDWPVASGHFFSQTGASPDVGYAITNDAQASFWSEFQRLGGWPVLGYPTTRRFNWHNQLTQATQRAVLQWSAVAGQVEFANVFDLVHDQGLDDALSQLYQIPPPAAIDEAGLPYETIAERRLQWLDTRPAIKQKYCDAPGGADPVVLWGLPMSGAVNVADAGTVFVVRTQRAAFQEWVDGAPWAARGEVTVVLAGDVAKEFNLLPPESGVPEPAPARSAR